MRFSLPIALALIGLPFARPELREPSDTPRVDQFTYTRCCALLKYCAVHEITPDDDVAHLHPEMFSCYMSWEQWNCPPMADDQVFDCLDPFFKFTAKILNPDNVFNWTKPHYHARRWWPQCDKKVEAKIAVGKEFRG